jgi:membrane-bound lytic murein transglycosylase D
MQCKDLFMASVLAVSVLSAKAQKHQDFAMSPQMRVIKTDTIIMPKAIKPAGTALLASKAPPAREEKKGFKPVPLAGESYYGNMNDYVMEFVRKYLTAHNKSLSIVQGRSNERFSLIDNVLTKHEIPRELKYLAVIESALNNNAVSRAGAVGPWQFMASTARLMGLKVSKGKDERRDLYKSTNAAAKYLSYLYGQLNDWLLVVAAYNSGPAPIHRAIARTGSTNFWDIKKHLPRETQGHVLAFIATATIFENMSKFIGIANIPADLNLTPEPIAVKDKKVAKPMFSQEELQNMAIVRLAEPLEQELLCQELGMDKKQLDKWNPDYDLFLMDTYSAEFYSLRIPKDKLDKFIEKKESMTKRSREIFRQWEM